jgi:group I intron endonuclease
MDDIIYIYLITNLVDKKVYVGQTRDPKMRWSQHKRCSRSNGIKYYLHRAMAKHTEDKFSFEIIEECATQELADMAEIKWIKHHNSRDKKFGYNIREGGSGGAHSEETKQLISKALKGRSNLSAKKLTDIQEREIAEKYSSGSTQQQLSREYDIDRTSIKRILLQFNVFNAEEAQQRTIQLNRGQRRSISTEFKPGQRPSIPTEFKPGHRSSISTEFSKGMTPHNKTVFTQEQLDQINNLHSSGLGERKIAAIINTSRSTIRRVLRELQTP